METVESLLGALNSPEWSVRRAAAEKLGQTKEKAAVEPLCRLLSDRSSDVRGVAAWALGEIGDPRALEPLRASMKGSDPSTREAIVGAMMKLMSGEKGE